MVRVLLTRRWPRAVEHALAARYELTTNANDRPLSAMALRDALQSFDVVCPTVTDPLTRPVFEGVKARLIANFGAGVDHIDLEAALEKGITVTNTPDVLSEATADIALALMLMTSRRLAEGQAEIQTKRWQGWSPTHLMGQDLKGKVLGLVGYGRIARALAHKARQCFNMSICYCARGDKNDDRARFIPDLDALLSLSDVVSLHCPGGGETHALIDANRLARMKTTAILINTARGSVVDYNALIDALNSRSLFAAGLDVYPEEPAVPQGLMGLPNVVLLPHLGSATRETREAMGLRAAKNIETFLSGRVPDDRVA